MYDRVQKCVGYGKLNEFELRLTLDPSRLSSFVGSDGVERICLVIDRASLSRLLDDTPGYKGVSVVQNVLVPADTFVRVPDNKTVDTPRKPKRTPTAPKTEKTPTAPKTESTPTADKWKGKPTTTPTPA